jgi:pyridoxine 4-dehydrogenase
MAQTGTAALPAQTITIGGDLTVSRIGFGAMRLTGKKVWGEYADRAGGIALLQEVVESGVTYIDTADTYGPFTNESLIHDALHPYPDNLVIASKGGFVRGGPGYEDLDAVGNRMYLRQAAFTSARRLGVDRIDLYYLHTPTARDVSFESQIETLAELQQLGVIRHIGLSNISAAQLRTAQTITSIAAVTAHYNVSVRLGSGLFAAARETGVVFSPWHPAVIPAGEGADRIKMVLERLATKYDSTVMQIGLAWQLHRSPLTLPIPGTTSIRHLKENLAAASICLEQDEVEELTNLVPEDIF